MANKQLNDETKRELTNKKEHAKTTGINKIVNVEEKSNQDKIKVLINGLSDKNGLIRRNYAEELGEIGTAALPELINALLNSKNVIQRRAAAKTLKLVKDPLALPHLIEALTNDLDPVVQCSSAGALAIFGEAAANNLITVLEKQEYTEMQYGLASWCLAFIGASAPNAIKKAAKSQNNIVKSAAIAALEEPIRQLQDTEAIGLLESAINSNAENVQIEAIKLVGKLYKIESLIPILISKIKNKNPDIRKASILSLMQLNIQIAIKQIKELLEVEKDKNVRKIIELAIKKLDIKKT